MIVEPLSKALTISEKEIPRQKTNNWTSSILTGTAAGYIGYRIGKTL
jgi:hypothetical protein